MKDNPCVRFDHIDLDGNKVYKPKKCFETDVEAIAYCKQMNKRWIDKFIHKLVAYKCYKCGKWHVGRSSAPLTEKKIKKIKNS